MNLTSFRLAFLVAFILAGLVVIGSAPDPDGSRVPDDRRARSATTR